MVRPLLFQEGLQVPSGGAVPGHGVFESPDRRAQTPRVTPLAFDRLEWGPAQLRIAAAVLGDQAALLMAVVRECWTHPEIHETARLARALAMEAGHYADRALQLDEMAAQSLNGTVR